MTPGGNGARPLRRLVYALWLLLVDEANEFVEPCRKWFRISDASLSYDFINRCDGVKSWRSCWWCSVRDMRGVGSGVVFNDVPPALRDRGTNLYFSMLLVRCPSSYLNQCRRESLD